MTQARQSLERASEWTEALLLEWWQRMGQIFGPREWAERWGALPPADWRVELSTWSVVLGAAVLVHYRRSGNRFPPNLSEIGKLAQELRPSLEPPKPTEASRDSLAVVRKFAAQERRDREWVDNYRRENPGTTVREAAMALLTKRGIVHMVPEAVLAESRAQEAASLQHAATVKTAKAKDFDAALEDAAEREAIQAEGGA